MAMAAASASAPCTGGALRSGGEGGTPQAAAACNAGSSVARRSGSSSWGLALAIPVAKQRQHAAPAWRQSAPSEPLIHGLLRLRPKRHKCCVSALRFGSSSSSGSGRNCGNATYLRTTGVSVEGRSQTTAAVAAEADQSAGSSTADLLYDCIVFDMDGTLTVSNIDFKRMRQRTGILEGDLFTVMESWGDPARVTSAYDVILEMEADACKTLELQPGLIELLDVLKAKGALVALVTRNTTVSVDAFFHTAGEHLRSLFSIVLTREFRYVKPDKRLLLHVADEWGVPPARLLMVGDSREDVECGKAAGTATCFIGGGGNEVVLPSAASATAAVTGGAPAAVAAPSGPDATFVVQSLLELKAILLGEDQLSSAAPPSDSVTAGAASSNGGAVAVAPAVAAASADDKASAAALQFMDRLFASGTVKASFCSYPRLAGAFGGATASTRPGDRVLHLGCGDGSLTKLIASQGLRVEGVDGDASLVAAAAARGLTVRHILPLGPLVEATRSSPLDCVFSFSHGSPGSGGNDSSLLLPWSNTVNVDAVWEALGLGKHLALGHLWLPSQAPEEGGGSRGVPTWSQAADALEAYGKLLEARGFLLELQSVERFGDGSGLVAALVAMKPGMAQFKKTGGTR